MRKVSHKLWKYPPSRNAISPGCCKRAQSAFRMAHVNTALSFSLSQDFCCLDVAHQERKLDPPPLSHVPDLSPCLSRFLAVSLSVCLGLSPCVSPLPSLPLAPLPPVSLRTRVPPSGRLCVHQAQELLAMDSGNTSDPLVILRLGGKEQRSPVMHKTLNPRWDEVFEFECTSSG